MLCVGMVVWSSGARAGIAFPEMPGFMRQCIREWLEQQARATSGAEARVRRAPATTRPPEILGPISKRIRAQLDQE